MSERIPKKELKEKLKKLAIKTVHTAAKVPYYTGRALGTIERKRIEFGRGYEEEMEKAGFPHKHSARHHHHHIHHSHHTPSFGFSPKIELPEMPDLFAEKRKKKRNQFEIEI